MNIFDIIAKAADTLREIASRVHCPDSAGGRVAAAIKADILQAAAGLEANLKPGQTAPASRQQGEA